MIYKLTGRSNRRRINFMIKQKSIHMKKCIKKIAGFTLSLAMVFTIPIIDQTNLKTAKADERIGTSFKYDYTYATHGYGYQLCEADVIKAEDKPAPYVIKTDMEDCTMSVGEIVPVYNGSARTIPVTIEYNGNQLTENIDYTLTYKDNVNSGTATVTATGMGEYTGNISRQFEIQPVDINSDIITKDFSNIKESYEYIIMEIMTPIKLKINNALLAVGIDYTVDYQNNLYPGTATVTFTGQGNYKGTITKTFNIVKKNISNVAVKAYFNSANKLVVTANVPDNGRSLIEGTDFVYDQTTDSMGNVTVTVKAIGDNFIGSKNVTIKAEDNPNKPVITTPAPTTKKITVGKVKLSKAQNIKGKKIKVTWKKVSGVTGYKVRFALSKAKLKKAKVKTVKKNISSYIIKKLKKKKYFVQVRAYKVVNKKIYMGAWSNVKSTKVRK